MKRRLFLFCMVCLLLAGCGRSAAQRATPAPVALSPGTVTRALTHGGRERSYVVHVPPSYDPARPPRQPRPGNIPAVSKMNDADVHKAPAAFFS